MLLPLYTITLRTPCMHTYIPKYTCIVLSLLLYTYIYTYMNRCCANSHMSLLVGTLTLRTFLYTIHISTSIHISYDRYFCIWSQAVRNHMCLCLASVHFEALCIQTHTHKYIHIYIYIDILVHEPMLCKLTYVCAPCECSHIEPFCIHQHFQKCTYIISKIHLYMNQCCANLLMTLCLWPCERSHLEPLCIHPYIHRNIFHITETFVYDSVLCELTYVCALASAHT